jgi:hypothetical protein
MQHPALRGEPVLRPSLLDMDQPLLPLAEDKVLEPGKLK